MLIRIRIILMIFFIIDHEKKVPDNCCGFFLSKDNSNFFQELQYWYVIWDIAVTINGDWQCEIHVASCEDCNYMQFPFMCRLLGEIGECILLGSSILWGEMTSKCKTPAYAVHDLIKLHVIKARCYCRCFNEQFVRQYKQENDVL